MLVPLVASLVPSDPPDLGIVGGEPTDDQPAAVGLYASVAGGHGDLFCSGTLITPDAVLTCAHCIDRLLEYQEGNADVYVVVGTEAPGAIEEFAEVIETAQVPRWDPGQAVDDTYGSDLGLLRLAEPIEGVEPIPYNVEPVDDTWIGLELDYYGWGATTGAQVDLGTKRHVQIPVTGLEPWWIVHGEDGSGLNTCNGDSGGTVLRTFDDGVTRLVAVPAVIWGAFGSDLCVDGYGWDLRVDLRRSFIEDTLAAWAPADPVDSGGEPAVVPEVEEGDVGEARGCGCGTSRASAAWMLAAVLLGLRGRGARSG